VTEQGEMIRFKFGLEEIAYKIWKFILQRLWKRLYYRHLNRNRNGVI
jgi:Phosphoenolpyruvate carboxylase